MGILIIAIQSRFKYHDCFQSSSSRILISHLYPPFLFVVVEDDVENWIEDWHCTCTVWWVWVWTIRYIPSQTTITPFIYEAQARWFNSRIISHVVSVNSSHSFRGCKDSDSNAQCIIVCSNRIIQRNGSKLISSIKKVPKRHGTRKVIGQKWFAELSANYDWLIKLFYISITV